MSKVAELPEKRKILVRGRSGVRMFATGLVPEAAAFLAPSVSPRELLVMGMDKQKPLGVEIYSTGSTKERFRSWIYIVKL